MMDVDFDKLRIILLPHILREGGIITALFRSSYKPLKEVHTNLCNYEKKVKEELEYGPTVKLLKKAIKDCLGIGENLIIIEDIPDFLTISLQDENDGCTSLLPSSNTALDLIDDNKVSWNRNFKVVVPIGYQYQEGGLKSIIDRWKMLSSQYEIIFES